MEHVDPRKDPSIPQSDQPIGGKGENERSSVIPVIEEQVQIDKKWVESGRVRVSKTVNETQESISVPLEHEEVNVQRVAKDQFVDNSPPPPVRQEGDTTIIPVLREVMVKRLLLVEELHITKKHVKKEHVQQVTLKKEEVRVDRRDGTEGQNS